MYKLLILIIFITPFKSHAQQVRKTDCCTDVDQKAVIVLRNSPLSAGNHSQTGTTKSNDNGVCNFKLNAPATTSAGVYNSSGVLIRTLWSGTYLESGCYSVQWDGLLDDDATQAPDGNYNIKILSNNVQYKWGLIGNNSDSFTDDTQYKNFRSIFDIALGQNDIYYATGYSENDTQTRKALLSDIHKCINVQPAAQTISAIHVATDANNVYWAGYGTSFDQGYVSKWFVFATKQSDDSQVNFTNGQSISVGGSGGAVYSSIAADTSNISGISVSANYVFVSRKNYGKISAYDKITGSLVSETNVANAEASASTGNYIWVSNGSNIARYSIGSNALLTSTGTLVSADEGSQLSISPTTAELAVSYPASSYNIKIYNGVTGVLNSTLGLAGGYVINGAAATANKFNNINALKYGTDGSLWVSDAGTYRVLHYNPDLSFTGTQVQYAPISYTVAVDQNDAQRVFVYNTEYQVDYSKDLSQANNGGWTLKNSWVPYTRPDLYDSFEEVSTLPNGKTYAKTHAGHFYQLDPNLGAVYEGDGDGTFEADGSLYNRQMINNNSQATITKRLLTGYAGNGMPQWGNSQTVVTTPVLGTSDYMSYSNNTRGESSNQDRYFFYSPYYTNDKGIFYHLLAMKTGGTNWDWKTSPTRPWRYNGPFPNNGYFDLSGHSENCVANVSGSNVFWHVNAELSRLTQVCYTNHYNEDGLFIGQFGNDRVKLGFTGDNSFFAGNSWSTCAYKVGDDIYYITNDDNGHSAIQCVKISNLNSIHEDLLPVTLSGAVTPAAPDSTDLMAYLPYASDDTNAITANTTKWKMSYSGAVAFQTSIYKIYKDSIDVFCKTYNGSMTVSRTLNSNTLNSWTLSGKILFQGWNDNFFDLLDANGKIIVRVTLSGSGTLVNSHLLNTATPSESRVFDDFSYSYLNNKITISYLNNIWTIDTPYENGALFAKPGSLQIKQLSNNDDHIIDVYKLNFAPGK